MFTVHTPVTGRLSASASAIALVMLLAGNVAAVQLDRDPGASNTNTCQGASRNVHDQHLRLKLVTTAGCNVIRNG